MHDEKKASAKQTFKFDVVYFIAAFFAILLIQDFFVGRDHLKTIPYSEFQSLIDKDGASDLVVGPTRITGTYKQPADNGGAEHFATVRVDQQIATELTRRNISFSGEPEPGVLQRLLSWIAPTALFILLWMFMLRPMMAGGHGGLMGIGKSRAKVYAESDIKVSFADVAGVDEAKQELAEVVGFLKDPTKYGRLGARIPKGILLVGPPGTGRPSWRARSQVSPASGFFQSRDRSSWKCSWASEPRGFAISSSRRVKNRPRSYLSTNSMRWAEHAASICLGLDTTKRRRR